MDVDSENIGINKGHANLIPAKPGEVRNPNGRPLGAKNRSTITREILELKHASGQTYEYAATLAVAEKATNGDVTAWDKLMDAAHGKVADKTELTGANGGPVAILSESDNEILALHKKKIIDEYLKTKGDK